MLLMLLLLLPLANRAVAQDTFPEDFLFGVSTSAYQIEGGWNLGGKGESIWDTFVHDYPMYILDGSTGDIACDSYHKGVDDVQYLRELGVQLYRLSISWSRILPNGTDDYINLEGIDYYNSIIDEVIRNGIQPVVTLYHWDLPQRLQDLGGWLNEDIVGYFEDYARVVFQRFGDRVKLWTTFNEPVVTCYLGYGTGIIPPLIADTGISEYACAHQIIKSHARAYHLYNDTFKPTQNGRLSIVLNSNWAEPGSDSALNQTAAERSKQFSFGWFANPIYSAEGDYPQVMRERIANRSLAQGYSASRLPAFTSEEVESIRGTYDYLALNTYSTVYSVYTEDAPIDEVSYVSDMSVGSYEDPSWPTTASPNNYVVPWGIRKILGWIKDTYNNPEVIITENGYADVGGQNDTNRINFFKDYIAEVLSAINEDGCNVVAYMAWSFLDNWEWNYGYTQKFGIVEVDFNSPNRTRTPKESFYTYRDIIKYRNPEGVNTTTPSD